MSNFALDKVIGSGAFGTVYYVKDKVGNKYAIKVPYGKKGKDMIKKEIIFYQYLQDKIPEQYTIQNVELVKKGKEQRLIMKYFTYSLRTYYKRYSNEDVSKYLEKFYSCVKIIKSCHNNLVIHCDIKPDNIVMNKKEGPYFIDFGLSSFYDEIEDIEGHFKGSSTFASIYVHSGYSVSYRDDIISLCYTFIYLLGGLPWDNYKMLTNDKKEKRLKRKWIAKKKEEIPIEKICEGLPNCFVKILTDAHKLSFSQKGNYDEYLSYIMKNISNDNTSID